MVPSAHVVAPQVGQRPLLHAAVVQIASLESLAGSSSFISL